MARLSTTKSALSPAHPNPQKDLVPSAGTTSLIPSPHGDPRGRPRRLVHNRPFVLKHGDTVQLASNTRGGSPKCVTYKFHDAEKGVPADQHGMRQTYAVEKKLGSGACVSGRDRPAPTPGRAGPAAKARAASPRQ